MPVQKGMTVVGRRATSKVPKTKPDTALEAGGWGGQFSHPPLTHGSFSWLHLCFWQQGAGVISRMCLFVFWVTSARHSLWIWVFQAPTYLLCSSRPLPSRPSHRYTTHKQGVFFFLSGKTIFRHLTPSIVLRYNFSSTQLQSQWRLRHNYEGCLYICCLPCS